MSNPSPHHDEEAAKFLERDFNQCFAGLVTSFLLELTIYPAIFAIWMDRALPKLVRKRTGRE